MPQMIRMQGRVTPFMQQLCNCALYLSQTPRYLQRRNCHSQVKAAYLVYAYVYPSRGCFFGCVDWKLSNQLSNQLSNPLSKCISVCVSTLENYYKNTYTGPTLKIVQIYFRDSSSERQTCVPNIYCQIFFRYQPHFYLNNSIRKQNGNSEKVTVICALRHCWSILFETANGASGERYKQIIRNTLLFSWSLLIA